MPTLKYFFSVFLFFSTTTFASQVHVYEIVEQNFIAENRYENPYTDVDLWVDLHGPNGLHYRIPAFWDGGQVFRARLVATSPGRWHWSTVDSTNDDGLDRKSGTFEAISWTEKEKEENPNRRGFIRVAPNKHSLEYADGSPFFYVADTWWAALTNVYPWNTDQGVAGISFQEAIAHRKAQGFNSIMMISSFPNESIQGLWASAGYKFAEDGSSPFEINERQLTGEIDTDLLAVEYHKIRPAYWQQIDRKFIHMWEQGFTPFVETVRRSEAWWRDNEQEREAFVNYVRYLWARYGAYNMIFSWVHTEGVENKHIYKWRPMVRKAYDVLGTMPYGQPRTLMAWGSTLETWARDRDHFSEGNAFNPPESGLFAPVDERWVEALPSDAFDIHAIGNRHRDAANHAELRTIFFDNNPKPGTNIEPFYPGWPVNELSEGQDLNTMPQFQMYGNVLNGGFAGHAWGDNYYSGVFRGSKEVIGHGQGFDQWTAKSMGHLKSFILDEGHDYRDLHPATLTNQVLTEGEFRVLALSLDKRFGLGFIAANHSETNLINLLPNSKYSLQWFNIDTGIWSTPMKSNTDNTGMLIMPNKPNDNGWAYRIIHI